MHRLDIIRGVPPISLGIEVAQVERRLKVQGNSCGSASNFSSDERFPSHRALVVEKDAVSSEDIIRFPVVLDDPISKKLRDRVWTAGVEGRRFVLWHGLDFTVKLACGCLKQPCLVDHAQ